MTPMAWEFDAVLVWSPFPAGYATEGTWAIGVTTYNLVTQGSTPEEALNNLHQSMELLARNEPSRHELFRVTRSGEVPIHEMCEQHNEVRITQPEQATDKAQRYILHARFEIR